jgi:histidyl-tRNA synthetase
MIGEYINDGEVYPAVGISFGLTSIFEILKNREEFNKNSNIEIFIIPMNVQIEALDLANKLRDMGINVEIEMKDRKLKRSLDFANRENIPYVIILGEDEINNNKFVLKDMFGSNNIDVTMDNLDVIRDYLK